MRLHQRRAVELWTHGALAYAIDYDHAPPKRTDAPGTCPVCGARLSVYNVREGGLCAPCQIRGDEPIPLEAWAQVAEHVLAALCAPWECDDGRRGHE